MNNATVEDVIASFPVIFYLQYRGADYHTVHSIRKLLRANARSVGSHLGGGALGHLSIIVSIAAYATIAPTHQWVNPESPGRASA
jgi:hypothetical protein